MSNKTDVTVLILRFTFGAILGALLAFVLMVPFVWLNIPIRPKTVLLPMGGPITLIAAISATIWGDKFLLGFMKALRFLKYFS